MRVEGELGELPGVTEYKEGRDSVELILKPDTSPQSILDHLRKQGKTIKHFEVASPSLNEIFLDIAGAGHE